MDLTSIPNLHPYLTTASGSDDPEVAACAQNFLLDERPPTDAVALYAPHFAAGAVADPDGWFARHRDYANEHLYIDTDESLVPYTFRALNAANRLTHIDPRLNLIRVEHADCPCALRGDPFELVRAQIEGFHGGDVAARDFFQGRCDAWNPQRDQRPSYVTTEIQVEDILTDGVANWAVRLRDRLGLGQCDPGRSGRPVEILLMRYRVDEVVRALDGQGHPAIPTVLDGDINPYFYPGPVPAAGTSEWLPGGRTVNLSPVHSESDYQMGCELLHPRIPYRPEHFYRAGVIDVPVSMPLERARGFHLPWVRLYADREDFGADLIAGSAA